MHVGAPLDFEDLGAIHPRRQNVGGRRDEQRRQPADSITPSPHRLHEERAIHALFCRARKVNHRRVDFEHGRHARVCCREHAFTAEVVVTLDDDVGPAFARQCAQPSTPHPAKLGPIEWRPHRMPVRAPCGPGAAGLHRDVDLVPSSCESFCHCLHVDRSAKGSGHGLIQRRR